MRTLIIIFNLFTLCHFTLSAKFLFLYLPYYSHLQNAALIADVLIERGHEAWISATEDLAVKLKLQERHITTIPLSNPEKLDTAIHDAHAANVREYWVTGKTVLNLEPSMAIQDIMLTDELFLSTIKSHNFDLVILDNTPISKMLCCLPYKFDIPFILYGSYYDPHTSRIPYSTSFMPFTVLPFSDQMTFLERLQNTIFTVGVAAMDPFSNSNAVAIYASEKPLVTVTDILRKAELNLVQWNFLLEYPAPFMPSVIPIGQVARKSTGELPNEFSHFLERSANGVVLVSFGSLTLTENNHVFIKLVSAFKNTKYNFIMNGNFTESDDRMMVSSWIPQTSLLQHKNIKLFITHCGANGLSEAIFNGVPMLGFPLFAEQPGNAFRMSARGYGITLDLFSSSQDDISGSIEKLIEDPKYKTKVKIASDTLQSRNTNATMDAVFWIEHILKFGGEYVRSSGVDMPFYQFLLLDILAFISAIAIVTLIVVYCMFKKIISVFCKSKTKTD